VSIVGFCSVCYASDVRMGKLVDHLTHTYTKVKSLLEKSLMEKLVDRKRAYGCRKDRCELSGSQGSPVRVVCCVLPYLYCCV
jgi:hypothetical protein